MGEGEISPTPQRGLEKMDPQIGRDLDSSLWNAINPNDCPCKGGGWLLSPFDSFHKCQTHYRGQSNAEWDYPHTEDEEEIEAFYAELALNDEEAAWKNYRAAWLMWEVAAGRDPIAWAQEVEAALPEKGTQHCACGRMFEFAWGAEWAPAKCTRCGCRVGITVSRLDGLLGAAANIVTHEAAAQADADAKAAGYSCALEQRWEEEARAERRF